MDNQLIWDLDANTVLQIVLGYTLRGVRHKISFYYALNESRQLDPAGLGKNVESTMIVHGFNQWLCSEIYWDFIMLSPTTEGFYKWTNFDSHDIQQTTLDDTQGLRFSLVRYNRDRPIYFSLYGIQKELVLPDRDQLDKMQPWFSQNFELEYGEKAPVSLGFRGCSSPVQAGADAPITGVGVKFFKFPDNQQKRLQL